MPGGVTGGVSGAVVGPASATDNAIARYDGATGKLVQNSGATISDSGTLTVPRIEAADLLSGSAIQASFELNLPSNTNVFHYGINTAVYVAFANARNYSTLVGISAYAGHFGSGTVGRVIGSAFEAEVSSNSTVTEQMGARTNVFVSSGNVTSQYGFSEYARDNYGTGTIASSYGFRALTPTNNGGGTITNNYAFYAQNQKGTGITNPYAFWYDSDGVYRINGDGVMAYYNPSFTKYVPGAVDYERVVQQWSSDVLQFGTEAGGTGTLRKMRLLGAGLILSTDILPTSNPAVVGQLWNDGGTLKVSAG